MPISTDLGSAMVNRHDAGLYISIMSLKEPGCGVGW